jgi:hypothetical protein
MSLKKCCQHCDKEFTPNKFHVNRQIFCTDKKCRQERNILRCAKFRDDNPNHFKKAPEHTCRTSAYNDQRREKRKLEKVTNQVFGAHKQMFVAKIQTFASVLNFFFLTFLGMTSMSSGGLRQTSAFNLSNLLNTFYRDGVSLVNADPNLKSKMEVIHEFVAQFDQFSTSEEIAKFFQLD